MSRKHFRRRTTDAQHWAELRRNPFAFAVALVSVSVVVSVLLAASAATASDAPSFAGVSVDRDRDVALLFALQATDAQIRLNAAQELGRRRAFEATELLVAATRDADARVREEAIVSLGALGAWRALPRLRELQITQGNEYVRFAAFEAEQAITARIAQTLQLARAEIQTIDVVAEGIVYAAANDAVYVLREETWEPVGYLPDTPRTLVLTDTGLVAAMREQGLYRSVDGGKTWEHLQFGRDTPARVVVTALMVHPQNARHMYAALARLELDGVTRTPLGIALSTDSGATWALLPDSPAWAITTRLAIDVDLLGYLFGEANGAPWRFTLNPIEF